MSAFSNLIDISSFFIGVLINLLLVALICYYFKRKIDNLELAQSEQAKMLYSVIHTQEQQSLQNAQSFSNNQVVNNMSFLKNLDLTNLGENVVDNSTNRENDTDLLQLENKILDIDESHDVEGSDSEIDSDSDEDEDNEMNEEGDDDDTTVSDGESVHENQESHENETKTVFIEEDEEQNYEKMTIKELKQLLESRGNAVTKRNIKKQELIDILVSMEGEQSSESDEEISIEKVGPSSIVEEENEITDDESQPEANAEEPGEEENEEEITFVHSNDSAMVLDNQPVEISLDEHEIQ